jgi:hypothetical protein
MTVLDEQKPEASPDDPVRRMALQLGLAGLAPFAVLSLWLAGIPADHVWRATTILLLAGYGAVILSFLGGTRWGLAVAGHGGTARDVAISVVPALIGWAALLMPPHYGFVLLAVAFAGQGAWDALAGQSGILPAWFARLRMQLTVVVVIAMVIAFAATAGG